MDATNFKIGAGDLKINGVSIGHTTQEGVVVSYEPDVHLHMSGKFGSTPVKASIIGSKLTLKVTMAESILNNMDDAFAGVIQANGKIKFGGIAGTEVTGKTLTLIPFDGTESWVFRNAVPTSSVEVAYQPDAERVYQVTFTAMIEAGVPDNENMAYVS